MTTNQIEAIKARDSREHNLRVHLENVRANIAREVETHRSNVANEDLKRQQLREEARKNLVTEQHARDTLSESYRQSIEEQRYRYANLNMTRQLEEAKQRETARHNLMSESIDKFRVQEQSDYWRSSVQEQVVHNRASEGLSKYAADIQSSTNLSTARMNYQSSLFATRVNQQSNMYRNQTDRMNTQIRRDEYQLQKENQGYTQRLLFAQAWNQVSQSRLNFMREAESAANIVTGAVKTGITLGSMIGGLFA